MSGFNKRRIGLRISSKGSIKGWRVICKYLNLRLVGSLHGQSEAAGSGVPRLDDKLVVFVDEAPLQAVAVSLHLVRIATGLDRDLRDNKRENLAIQSQSMHFIVLPLLRKSRNAARPVTMVCNFPDFSFPGKREKLESPGYSRGFPGKSL